MVSSVGLGLNEEKQVQQFKKSVLNMVPLGRMGNPDEIASDDSSYITDIELFVGDIAQI
jgi:hypothetical protein